MEQITTIEGVIGKTIARIQETYDNLFVFFSDDTFCVIVSDGWGSDQSPKLSDNLYNIQAGSYNDVDLVTLGFITEQQRLEAHRENEEMERQLIEQEEIATLKQLAKKYPDQL